MLSFKKCIATKLKTLGLEVNIVSGTATSSHCYNSKMTLRIKLIGNDAELDRILNRDFKSPGRTGFVEVGNENVCLPISYKECEEPIKKFEVRDDDVFIIAHPKTGTTWLQEMLWILVNNLNYKGAKENFYRRTYLLELAAYLDLQKAFGVEIDLFSQMDQAKSPRVIKSHLHWSLLPEQIRSGSKSPKIVVILRSVEDTCVSYYHHCRFVEGYKGTFGDFCKLFLGGRVCWGPYWSQVLSCWEQRSKPNILFVRYEDMKQDLPSVLKKVAEFLGKTITEEQVIKLADYLSFEAMRNNAAVNCQEWFDKLKKVGYTSGDCDFIRSGKVGSYKDVMSPDLIEQFKIYKQQHLSATGL